MHLKRLSYILCLPLIAFVLICFSGNTCLAKSKTGHATVQQVQKQSHKVAKAKTSKKHVVASRSAHKAAKGGKSVKTGKAAKVAASHKKASTRVASAKDMDRRLWLERAKKNSDVVLGKASWYGRDFHERPTASGLPYDMYTFTAAHRTLPLGTVVRVTDQYNGKSVMVCVTDRGPYVKDRMIDMSYASARRLNLNSRGVATVGLEVVSDADGHPLDAGQGFYVQLESMAGKDKIGPYKSFADAAAMHEAVLHAHPEAQVILEKIN